jgi:hypothetical protein
MRTIECPKCGKDIGETFQEAEPDVGLMNGGWYCGECDIAVSQEDDDDIEDYER